MRESMHQLCLEELESRDLLSASILLGGLVPDSASAGIPSWPADVPALHQTEQAVPAVQTPGGKSAAPAASSLNSAWYTPAQIQQAYGFNQVAAVNGVALTGAGQTIAIIDVYDDPNILSDSNTFSKQFGLPQFNQGTGSPTFVKLNENGQNITSEPRGVPHPQTNSAWTTEISLDVEWAHAIAPQANIVLIEANSGSTSDVFEAMHTAQNYPGVSVVSMSWGYNESDSFMQSKMTGYDSTYLTTPTGHTPITFVAATLDNGSSYGVFWPAISPNVVGVGGTVLTLNAGGGYGSETGWSYSTGGISKYEAKPSYQSNYGVVPSTDTMRTNPDVAYAATNFAAYDTAGGYHGWFQASGTSAGTPQWAGLIALADQERALNHLPSLSSTQTLDALYQLASQQFQNAAGTYAYFHDITSGSNGAYSAGAGYDLVTGIGTPEANELIPALATYGTSSWPVV